MLLFYFCVSTVTGQKRNVVFYFYVNKSDLFSFWKKRYIEQIMSIYRLVANIFLRIFFFKFAVPMDLDVKMKAVVLGACFLIVSTLAGHFLYELYLVEDS